MQTSRLSRSVAVLSTLACSAASQLAIAQGIPGWTPERSGARIYEAKLKQIGIERDGELFAIRFSRHHYTIGVMAIGSHRAIKSSSWADQDRGGGTLRELTTDRTIVAAVNGGFITSYAFPQPLGLTIVEKKPLARRNPGKLMSGILCIRSDGNAVIDFIASNNGSVCQDALQNGPLIVEPRMKPGIPAGEEKRKPHVRAAVCTSGGDALFVYSSATTLRELMRVMIKSEAAGGLGCDTALNMGGDQDAGLFWKLSSKLESRGEMDASLATAVYVSRRSTTAED
jgi:hypothetical protein